MSHPDITGRMQETLPTRASDSRMDPLCGQTLTYILMRASLLSFDRAHFTDNDADCANAI